MSRPKVAIFDFACCEGCQLQIVNMEEEILDMVSLIEPVEWREAMSEQSEQYDIAIIEGSITRPEDEKRLRVIRAKARILVALGACATLGGVNKLKNRVPMEESLRTVYGKDAGQPHLATSPTRAIHEVVAVDVKIHGCPISGAELAHTVRSLAIGRKPIVPNHPVCVECKIRGNPCRYDYNEVCLGPVIRAGCNAPCPSAGFQCFGCRGMVDDPNVNAAQDVMHTYGKTVEDLKGKLALFNS